MLASDVDFDNLAAALRDNSSALIAVVDSAAEDAADAVTLPLPIASQSMSDLVNGLPAAWTQPLITAIEAMATALEQLGDNPADAAVRNVIYDALEPTGLLADYDPSTDDFGLERNGSDEIVLSHANKTQIKISSPGDDVEISLTLGFLSADLAGDSQANVDLGLPSLPFFQLTTGDLDLHVGAYVKHLTFGVQDGSPFVGFDNALQDDLTIFTHASFADGDAAMEGQLGFLQMSAEDNRDPGSLGSSMHLGFGFDVANLDTAQLHPDVRMLGRTQLDLNLSLQFVGGNDDYPSLGAGFQLDWEFDQLIASGSPVATLLQFGDAPTAGFTDVRLDVGSYINEVVSPVVESLQTALAPVLPVIEVLNTPIPLLSQLGEWLNLGSADDFSLVGLAEALSSTGALPPDIKVLVDIALAVNNFIILVDNVSVGDGINAQLGFGDFEIDGLVAGTDLRGLPPASPAGGADWSSLQAKVTGNANAQIMGALSPAARKLLGLQSIPQQSINLAFPLFDDPATGVFQLLLGRDADLVRLDVDVSAPISMGPVIDFDILGILEAYFNPGTLTLEAHLGFGYDTFGLRQLATQALNGDPIDVGLLGDGFYIANRFTNDGGIHEDLPELQVIYDAGIGVNLDAGFFSVGGGGSLTANLGVGIRDDGSAGDFDASKSRFFELSGCVFEVSGGFDATAFVKIKIGVDLGFGFVGIRINESFGGSVVDFSIGGNCPDAVQIAEVNGSSLTINASDENEKFFIEQLTLLVDHDDDSVTDLVSRDVVRVTRAVFDFSGTPQLPQARDFVIRQSGDLNPTFVDPITQIVAAGRGGHDTIHIKSSVGDIDAILYGGLPIPHHQSSALDNDILIYDGTGHVIMHGGGGADRLIGGSGDNQLFGETGADVLEGGESTNFLDGGAGDDEIFAAGLATIAVGGSGDDTIAAGNTRHLTAYGDQQGSPLSTDGNDVIYTGAGDADVRGGGGSDEVHWYYGNGALTFQGNQLAGLADRDQIFLLVSELADKIDVGRAPIGAEHEVDITIVNSEGAVPSITLTEVEDITIEGSGGADTTDIWNLHGTSILSVSVNLADEVALGSANDVTHVHGFDGNTGSVELFGMDVPAFRWDEAIVTTGHVGIAPEAVNYDLGVNDPLWSQTHRDLIHGVTSVRLEDWYSYHFDGLVVERRGAYIVNVSSQTPVSATSATGQDTLNVNLYDGAYGPNPAMPLEILGERAVIYSVAGLTNLDMGAGGDAIYVALSQQIESDITSNGFLIRSGGYFGELNLDAGPGWGTVIFDAGFESSAFAQEPRGAVNMVLEDRRLSVDQGGWAFGVNNLDQAGRPVASHPFDFVATNGQLVAVEVRGSNLPLPDQTVLPRPQLVVKSTLPSALTQLHVANHDVIISSAADGGNPGEGDLSEIRGILSVLAERIHGSGGSTNIVVNDFGATAGNRAASLSKLNDSDFLIGFAGPQDDALVGWTETQPGATIGTVTLMGSNDPTLRERLTLLRSVADQVILKGNDGPDRFDIIESEQPVEVRTGSGQDYVTLGNELVAGLRNLGPVTIVGGASSRDRLRIHDAKSPAAALYALDNESLATGPFAGSAIELVHFSHVEDIALAVSEQGSLVGIGTGGGPFGPIGPPRTLVTAPSASDTLYDYADTDNLWEVGDRRALLNRTVLMIGVENLVGGNHQDLFRMRTNAQLGGSLFGAAIGDLATNTLSYARWTAAVDVDLSNFSAERIGGNIAFLNQFVGSQGDHDRLRGFDANAAWTLTGQDEGHLVLPDFNFIRTDFKSFETIQTGHAFDTISLTDQTVVTQRIVLTPNLAGTFDGISLESVTHDATVDLQQGTVTYEDAAGNRLHVADTDTDYLAVVGGLGNDILIGNGQANILVGGDGDDILIGHGGDDVLAGDDGRDLIIGGSGLDQLTGGNDDDLLISGTTSYDNDFPALLAIRDTWRRTDLSYTERTASLRTGPHALRFGTSVFTDARHNVLSGGAHQDWFFIDDQFDNLLDLDPTQEEIN